MDWQAIWLSLKLAGCTTLILCLLGLPLAYWLAASRWRWKFLVEAVVALPLVLPPTVLGYYLLIAMGPQPARARLRVPHRSYAAFLISGPAPGLGPLQSAFRSAAFRRGVRRG